MQQLLPNSQILLTTKPQISKPNPGTFDKNIFNPQKFLTNHYKLKFDHYMTVYQYSIKLTPEPSKDARSLYKKAIQRSNISEYLKDFYHQGQIIFALQKFENQLNFVVEFEETKNQEAMQFTLTINLTKEIPLTDIDKYDGTGNSITQIFNFFVKDKMEVLNYVEIGQNSKFYDPEQYEDISDILGVIKGFSMTTKVCFDSEMQLLVNPISKIIRNETALDFINTLKQHFKHKYVSKLAGECVLTSYGNQKLLRINGVESKMTPFSKIPGTQVSFIDHYYRQYKIKQANGQNVYIVPELVYMSGLTDRMRNNMLTMKQVAEFTRIEPQEKIQGIKKIVRDIRSLGDENGISLDGQEVEGYGFVLEKPEINIMGGTKIFPNDKGIFQAKDIKATKGLQLADWIFIHTSNDRDCADLILNNLQKAAQNFGIEIKKPGYIEINTNVKPYDFKLWEQKIMTDINKYGKPQLVFSLMNKKSAETTKLYSQLKKLLLSDIGCNHQNVLASSFRNEKTALSIASKIVQQIFVKKGENIWKTEVPKNIHKHTMLVGIDVYHKTIQKKNSVAAFISTTNPEFTEFYSQTDIHPTGQELLPNFGDLFKNSLEYYQKANKKLPDCIIIYRDGVGSGQVDLLLDDEINQLKTAILETRIDYNPEVAVMLVNKRINDKMFTKYYQNPTSGSVLHQNIVAQNVFEFFLTAQYVTQGTATPSKYSLIYNTTILNQDDFILLTYWQCFNYMNWQGAVRVPSVAMYAHKLAYLAGEYVEREIIIKDRISYA